ncbi:MAG: nuclear transport factor 2 family protein [Bacteroidales bacterium]|nr:nuclear transport factor 2 family protein [Bacteroidales bacterium]
MKTSTISILTFLVIIFFTVNINAQSDSIDYLGQKAPGYYPEKFASGIFMSNEWGPVFSPDGNELFYTWQNPNGSQDYHINYMKKTNGVWSEPVPAPFTDKGGKPDIEPNFTPDGKRLYFDSERAGGFGGADIWYVEKNDTGWSEPLNAGAEINSPFNDNFASFSPDSSMFFCSDRDKGNWDINIFYAKYIDSEYQTPIKLSDTINTSGWDACPTIVKDKLIFQSTRSNGFGSGDICFSQISNDKFGKTEIMSPCFNTSKSEMGIVLSPDKKYLFFKHKGEADIYWVDVETFDYLGAKEAPFNYVTSWYAGIPAQMEIALHPELIKRRVSSESDVSPLSYSSLISMVNSCSGCIEDVKKGRKDISILHETENMASAKVLSDNFFDYLHLVKFKNYWKVINVAWDYYTVSNPGDSAKLVTTLNTYLNCWETGDSAKMKELIHPHYAGRKALSHTEVNHVNKTQLLEYISAGTDSELDFEILDLYLNTASVKVNMNDSLEYLHLTYQNDKWYVINSLRNFTIETSQVSKIYWYDKKKQVEIFPNPASQKIIIVSEVLSLANANYQLCDVNGKIMKQGMLKSNTIYISDLPKGIYMLSLLSNNIIITEKIMVE